MSDKANSGQWHLDTLGQLMDQLAEHGDKVFLRRFEKEGSVTLTYATLSDQLMAFARGLLAAGVKGGDTVALFAPLEEGTVIAAFGAIRAGAVLTLVDTQTGDETLRHILKDSGARWAIAPESLWPRIQEVDAEIQAILLDVGEDHEHSYHRLLQEGDAALPELDADATAVLFYTSGTTGPPKGVPLTHRNLTFQLHSLIEANLVTPGSRMLMPLPLHHVYPFVIGQLAPAALGLTVIVPYMLTGPQLVRAIGEGDVTLVIGVPRLYEALYSGISGRFLDGGGIGALYFRGGMGLSRAVRKGLGVRIGRAVFYPLHKRVGPNMRMVACGGAPLDTELAWNLESLGWQVGIGYGLTETSPLLTINPPGKARIGAVGRAVPGIELRLGPAEGAPAAPGGRESGEVQARGPGVFKGYHHLEEETKEAFTDDGWYRTGDLGYFDGDGYLYLMGRASTVLVTEGGENVQPEEVEAIYAEHAFIEEAGVLQVSGKLVAVIVPEPKAIKSAGVNDFQQAVDEAVRAQARKLSTYKRVNEYVISRDALDRTRLGKVQRHKLKERYETLKSGEGEAKRSGAPVAIDNMTADDRQLLDDDQAYRLWKFLAERYANERLTPDSHLQLDLGIDSLEWVELTLSIRERIGVELTDEAAANVETVRDLLGAVAESASTDGAAAHDLRELLKEPEAQLTETQRRWLQPLNAAQKIAGWLLYQLNRLLALILFRLRVKGREHVPGGGAYVIAPNHLSYLDAFVVAAALDFRRLQGVHWAGWTGVIMKNWFTRTVSRIAQTVPVEPERAVLSSLAFAASVLQRGKALVWFPEGRRSLSGELQPFRPGIAIVLQEHDAPIIPVWISGTYDAMPPDRKMFRLERLGVRFGEPCTRDELAKEGEGEEESARIADGLRKRVIALGEMEARDS
jgi:long-chain acyl-CoA synthetase